MDAFAGMDLRLEKLNALHNVLSFDCQAVYLNDFLQKVALSETLNDISLTYVLVGTNQNGSENIIGYFALEAEILYDREKTHGYAQIPVVHIKCLARHKALRGQKVGSVLMYQALHIVAQASALISFAGVHLAFTLEGKSLYERFKFGEHPYGEHNMFLPISTVREYADFDTQD